MIRVAAFAAAAFASLASAAPLPQGYPSRPIHVIVPAAPGGLIDTLIREVGDRLGEALHVPVVIDNKPGAAGVIGNEIAARAAPDGYTLLLASSATHIIASHMIATPGYDPLRDFTTVYNIAYATSVVVVNDSLPIHTVGELIAYAKAHPGRLNYASSGIGSANHLDTEVFAALAGIELTHVPYRGTADGYRALLADDVQLMFGAITSALPYVKTGKLRALAVLVDHRSPLLPDVPTIAEAGLGSVDVRKWLGLVAPAGVQPEIVDYLNQTLDRTMQAQDMRDWMARHGLEIAGGSAQHFNEVLRADDAKWAETMRRLHVRAE